MISGKYSFEDILRGVRNPYLIWNEMLHQLPFSLFVDIPSGLPISSPHAIHNSAKISHRCTISGELDAKESAIIKPYCQIGGSVSLGQEAIIGPNSTVYGNISIGRYSNLNGNNLVAGEIDIGSFCAIANSADFLQTNHPRNYPAIQARFHESVIDSKLEPVNKGPIKIGSDVWIGRRAMILSGVEIGHGAIIGAGAVVTKNVQPYEIVAGVPAMHRGWRFSEELRDQLLSIAWWTWDDERINNNKQFFKTDLSKVDDIYNIIN
ncbi:Acetyltransferase (isoleucine patch superfamily) [Halanaeroarchaeum sp. HSR-CO]|uniref:CatB-related O-acetyltransferase n=1 Tax=Halanaeroarchaeum sp. HSR-CO TaxID=2866382 RepID=UPI00217F124C|nr:DapH/DapD/GlmU-related protein [Halanaeroarchaeum sp. HSR-CO]UWG48100.1 Acetyltransferase (isoleucine patch superfamily) [Halanaeroarchaeum sp. HSR-CO]